MISLTIQDKKQFMNRLLIADTFDQFQLIESTIKMGITYKLDGRLNKDFYDSDVAAQLGREYCYWKEAKSHITGIIRGKHMPVSFKIIFGFSQNRIASLLQLSGGSFRMEDIEGIYLNMNYDRNRLLLTSGISYRSFSLDKSLELVVDDYLKDFMRQHQLS